MCLIFTVLLSWSHAQLGVLHHRGKVIVDRDVCFLQIEKHQLGEFGLADHKLSGGAATEILEIGLCGFDLFQPVTQTVGLDTCVSTIEPSTMFTKALSHE